jgi:hypothetical protein
MASNQVQRHLAVLAANRGKTVTKPFLLNRLGLSLSEEQIPQVVEDLKSGDKPREALETAALLSNAPRTTSHLG